VGLTLDGGAESYCKALGKEDRLREDGGMNGMKDLPPTQNILCRGNNVNITLRGMQKVHKMNTAKCKGTHTVPLLDALAQLPYKTLLGTKER